MNNATNVTLQSLAILFMSTAVAEVIKGEYLIGCALAGIGIAAQIAYEYTPQK